MPMRRYVGAAHSAMPFKKNPQERHYVLGIFFGVMPCFLFVHLGNVFL